jgi:hypothetical protein
MNTANKVRAISLAGCLACLAWAACPGPQPIPTPIGPVADAAAADAPLPIPLFDHKVFDCHQDVVKTEYQAARPDVKKCLSLPGAPDCLVALVGPYNAATAACLARDLGGDANASVLAGSSDPVDVLVAAAARTFINNQTVGYR